MSGSTASRQDMVSLNWGGRGSIFPFQKEGLPSQQHWKCHYMASKVGVGHQSPWLFQVMLETLSGMKVLASAAELTPVLYVLSPQLCGVLWWSPLQPRRSQWENGLTYQRSCIDSFPEPRGGVQLESRTEEGCEGKMPWLVESRLTHLSNAHC